MSAKRRRPRKQQGGKSNRHQHTDCADPNIYINIYTNKYPYAHFHSNSNANRHKNPKHSHAHHYPNSNKYINSNPNPFNKKCALRSRHWRIDPVFGHRLTIACHPKNKSRRAGILNSPKPDG